MSDSEAVQAGVVDGHLYCLSQTGVLLKDNVADDHGIERILITDSTVILYYRDDV